MCALWYLLDENKIPRPVEEMTPANMMKVEASFSDPRRVVGHTKLGEYRVSTVFLVLNHRVWDKGPPSLFETMVFNDAGTNVDFSERTDSQKASMALFGVDLFGNHRRYSTWEEAETGHRETVRMIESITGEKPVDVDGFLHSDKPQQLPLVGDDAKLKSLKPREQVKRLVGKMVLYQKNLKGLQCQAADCDHKHEKGVFLAQRCHAGAGVTIKWVPERTVLIYCAKCTLPIAAVAVEPSDEPIKKTCQHGKTMDVFYDEDKAHLVVSCHECESHVMDIKVR